MLLICWLVKKEAVVTTMPMRSLIMNMGLTFLLVVFWVRWMRLKLAKKKPKLGHICWQRDKCLLWCQSLLAVNDLNLPIFIQRTNELLWVILSQWRLVIKEDSPVARDLSSQKQVNCRLNNKITLNVSWNRITRRSPLGWKQFESTKRVARCIDWLKKFCQKRVITGTWILDIWFRMMSGCLHQSTRTLLHL